MKELKGLSLTGTGSMKAVDIKTDKLSLTLTGTGNVDIAGKVAELDLKVTGTGQFNGAALQSKTARVSHSGLGRAVVKVSEELDVTIGGIGTVQYVGKPRIRKNILGLGSVTPRR